MPVYEFSCSCGHKIETFVHKIKTRGIKCKKCGRQMKKAFSRVNTDCVDKPRWSGAMGVNISRIPEAKKAYPGSVYNHRGDLLVRSRKHKLQELKRRGMIEFE